MTVRLLAIFGLQSAGVLVPLGALAAASRAWDGVIAPFGWTDLTLVHLLGLLPLSLLIARSTPCPVGQPSSQLVAAAWLLVAIGVTWWTVSRGSAFADQLDASGP